MQAHALLQGVDPWGCEQIEADLTALLGASGLKPDELYQPIREAIAASDDGPRLGETLEALGREETLRRLETALENAR
jgi:lysyl-tRNA synthetase class I